MAKNPARPRNIARQDGYLSAVMGHVPHNYSVRNRGMALQLIVQEYHSRGLAASIIDRPAQDALSQGIMVVNDENNLIANEIDRLRVTSKLILALKQALLYGASAIMPIMDDSPSLSQPVDLTAITRVSEFRPIAGTRIKHDNDFDQDITSENFGKPRTYMVTFPRASGPVRVHYTRLIPIPGEGAYMDDIVETVPWQGKSVLASCWTELRDYQDGCKWALQVLERKQQATYKMKGMAELLEEYGKDEDGAGEAIIQKRISNVDAGRNVLRSVVVDAEDEYNITDLTLSGIADVINEQRVSLSASSRTPVTVLFGETPKGLGATGSGELAIYQSRLGELRVDHAAPALERMVELITAQKGTSWPKEWKATFNPIWAPSAKEKAEVDKVEAEARKLRVDAVLETYDKQLLGPEEARLLLVKEWPEQNFSEIVPNPDDFPLPLTPTPKLAPNGP